MAKLNFCIRTHELEVMNDDGRHLQARERAISLLRDGYSSTQFLNFVAELLTVKRRSRGGQERPPTRWLEIVERFNEVLELEQNFQISLEIVAKEMVVSESTVARAVKIYRDAKEEADALS